MSEERYEDIDFEPICREALINGVSGLIEEITKLKAENKDLKQQCESRKGLITVGGKQQFALTQRVDELEQKLEKIKEECKYNFCNFVDGTCDSLGQTILQIIEGDNNE